MKTFAAIALLIVLFCGCSAVLSAQGPPTELKDWQTSLRSFIQHIDSAPKPTTEPGKASTCQPPPVSYLNPPLDRDNRVYFQNMTANGCAGENADDVFGPLVQFEGKFISVSALSADQRDQHWMEYFVAMSFESTHPTAILFVYLAEADLASWQRLTPGAQVRLEAELNCLTAWESNNGKTIAYSLVLKDAKVLP